MAACPDPLPSPRRRVLQQRLHADLEGPPAPGRGPLPGRVRPGHEGAQQHRLQGACAPAPSPPPSPPRGSRGPPARPAQPLSSDTPCPGRVHLELPQGTFPAIAPCVRAPVDTAQPLGPVTVALSPAAPTQDPLAAGSLLTESPCRFGSHSLWSVPPVGLAPPSHPFSRSLWV